MIKKISIALLVILVLIQFIPVEKNDSGDQQFNISNNYEIPGNVQTIFENACNDCHSNQTEYPWYSKIQPVGFWLNNHIQDGKRHLNFSEFTNRPLAYQNHKLEETIEMVEQNEMPIPSYTYMGLHPEANLTEGEKQEIIDWAKSQMAMLKATYPADSLVMRRRQ
ncbi:heme-binding domain-containing protein [Algoriphagus zhangzhouensis]|uniref:Haem-binding domain-containing protein n=1 Tax=Algoriphagus zhangzhouensis TaxID=1073327 RepID=A0A1M7ZE01_9BACT|nr:heme-binding domain-containing protein [Algoriphagus zhangzhouensis]TDY45927.1 heme-binding protein [Algoriphagus zhangzhouensis]SHO63108.1 Haem-binding domain-containing protein [Algoriphagus zhangzhouensis]